MMELLIAIWLIGALSILLVGLWIVGAKPSHEDQFIGSAMVFGSFAWPLIVLVTPALILVRRIKTRQEAFK